jgi:hypothetical protein
LLTFDFDPCRLRSEPITIAVRTPNSTDHTSASIRLALLTQGDFRLAEDESLT